MPCLDPINYPSLTPLQNEYLESIRDKLELNGCNLTNKQDTYLNNTYVQSLGWDNKEDFISGVNTLYQHVNFGLTSDNTWTGEWQ